MKKRFALLAAFVLIFAFAISAQASKGVFVNKDANLRYGPGTDYGVYISVDEGTILQDKSESAKDDRNVTWFKVSYEGRSLWISSKCASKISKPTTNARRRVIATADVNLRKGPGLKYKVYVAVLKGSSFKYLGVTKKDNRKVKWFKISYYGKSLWISSKASKRKDYSSPKRVHVDEDANLRRGPGMDYSVYTSVPEGKVLTYLKKSEEDERGIDWYKVSYKKKSYWISSATCHLK